MADKIKKYLLKVSSYDSIKIEKVILLIGLMNFDTLDIIKMKGFKNRYRARIGNHRIIFRIEDGRSIVEDLKNRDENTY